MALPSDGSVRGIAGRRVVSRALAIGALHHVQKMYQFVLQARAGVDVQTIALTVNPSYSWFECVVKPCEPQLGGPKPILLTSFDHPPTDSWVRCVSRPCGPQLLIGL